MPVIRSNRAIVLSPEIFKNVLFLGKQVNFALHQKYELVAALAVFTMTLAKNKKR